MNINESPGDFEIYVMIKNKKTGVVNWTLFTEIQNIQQLMSSEPDENYFNYGYDTMYSMPPYSTKKAELIITAGKVLYGKDTTETNEVLS